MSDKNRMRLIAITMFAALLSLAAPLSAQDQPPQATQASPSSQSPSDGQPQTEPAPAAPQTPAQASPQTEPPPASPPPAAAQGKKPGTKASAQGHKVVVRNGGAKDESAQLAPGISKEQELRSRETTTKLLAATDTNLKGIAGRPLTPPQQSLLGQIHAYIRQSQQASDAGDLARAQTLAYKARLLSDELRK